MVRLKHFEAALRGDDARLREKAGPGGVVRVDQESASAVVVPAGGKKMIIGTTRGPTGGDVHRIKPPKGFRIRDVAVEGGRYVLTAEDGRTVRGTPDQFTAQPKILDPEHNPNHDAQVEQAFLETHLMPERERDVFDDAPESDRALTDTDVIAEAGQASITENGEQVFWVDFDCAGPERVRELLPHARAILAALDDLTEKAAPYLTADPDEIDDDDEPDENDWVIEADEDEIREASTPTGLCVYLTGDFELHFEAASGVLLLDGYWISVQFTADHTPAGFTVEA